MKKIVVLSLLLAFVGGLSAQTAKKLFSNWKLKSYGLSFGLEQDMVQGFSAESFARMSGHPDLLSSMNLDESDLNVHSGVCENPHLRFQAIFQPALMPNIEIHTTAIAIINRIDALTYYSSEHLNSFNNYLTLNSWGHEAAAEIAFARRARLGALSFYGGLGTNLGFHFGNEMHIFADLSRSAELMSFAETGMARYDFSEEEQQYQYLEDNRRLSTGISQRVFVLGGASLTLLKRLELGMEGRYGYGYRSHFEGKMLATNLRSWGLFARWNLK